MKKERTPRKEHKMVISTINSPTKFLEQHFNLILKDYLTISKHCIKKNWEIQNIITKKTFPDDCIMISLDVVAMFPNIPLE